ncbi:O-methyltransferase [Burkholderiaceae bacterium DAT-1]|nr:O-methyltransferase [Burkholderiaceae bacterium DAT-1]
MPLSIWTAVDQYFSDQLHPSDPVLDRAQARADAAGLPAHQVAPNQGAFLQLMIKLTGATRILEIGTLGAYSTIWMARGLSAGGIIHTLEANPVHAAVARQNIADSGVSERIRLHEGKAADTLPSLVHEGPFDLVFIDADKPSNPIYLKWALELSRPGTLIIGDNVVRDGKVVDAASDDANVQGVRTYIDLIAADPRLEATALQTVGCKGYDGFVIARVLG